jgi:hypothetical protein
MRASSSKDARAFSHPDIYLFRFSRLPAVSPIFVGFPPHMAFPSIFNNNMLCYTRINRLCIPALQRCVLSLDDEIIACYKPAKVGECGAEWCELGEVG